VNFRVDCECGIPLKVSEASAGGSVRCVCGRSVPVPPLRDLRVRAGLPPYNIAPEVLIEHLLASGELPPDKSCVECGAATDGAVRVITECERTMIPRSGVPWPVGCLLLLFSPVLYLLFRAGTAVEDSGRVEEHGRDKIYTLPVPVCADCRPRLHRQTIQDTLRKIPIYEQLLDKFPDAVLRLET
jgi:hypothetical protein